MSKHAAARLRALLNALRTALAGIHPVDRSLLLCMAVLLGQSAYSLFVPGPGGPLADEIDIIVRTAAASIFGYFLSGSFLSCAGQDSASPLPVSGHMLKTADSAGPTGRIGFSAAAPETVSGTAETRAAAPARCVQTTVAAVLGLFCLVVLVILRNTGGTPSNSATATVVQFRDFVSGCVGYLIGSPTHLSAHTSS